MLSASFLDMTVSLKEHNANALKVSIKKSLTPKKCNLPKWKVCNLQNDLYLNPIKNKFKWCVLLNKSFQIRFTIRVPTNYESFINTRSNHVAACANSSARARGKEYGGYLMDIIIPYYYIRQNARRVVDKMGTLP